MYIKETREIKVHKTYDVIVCGGGFGGISAALAAKRQGKSVLLLERQFMLGGLGTAGLITIYLPLCDGYGHQVSFGIVEELFRLSISEGYEDRYPENWLDGVGTRTENDKRFLVQYNAQLFAILAEKLLLREGVDILYGSYAVDAKVSDGKITHIVVENKSGRLAYAVGSVVDATGDCDIAAFAGAPTKNFEQGNVLAGWYYCIGKQGYMLSQVGAADISDEEKKKTGKVYQGLIDRRFTGVDGDEVSEFVCLSHNATLDHLMKRREEDPARIPVTMATIPQLRMTRKIVGEYEMSHEEEHTYFEDSIGMVSNWRKRGPIYEVPFRTLYSSKIKNLICAGRCTSVNEALWDIMRVIPCCAVTGQAAGTAAAMTDDFTTLDVKTLQAQLVADGVVLHEKDIL
jgi:hypothetical protein